MKLGEKVSFIFDWPSLADVRKQKRFNAFRREGNTVFHSCLDRAFRKCFLCVRLFSKGKMFPILDSSMLFFSSAVKKLESDQFSWKYGTLKSFRSKKWEGSRNWRVIVSICHHLVFGFPFPLHAHPAHMTSDYFTEKARTFYLVRIVKMVRIICKSCNLLTGKIENFSGRYLNTCRIIHVKKKDYLPRCKTHAHRLVMKSALLYREEMADGHCIAVQYINFLFVTRHAKWFTCPMRRWKKKAFEFLFISRKLVDWSKPLEKNVTN